MTKVKSPKSYKTAPDFDFQHIDNEKFREELKSKGIDCTTDIDDRFYRSFGQSAQDLVTAYQRRIPDIVVWPQRHEDVEVIVMLANKLNIVVIPFGGLKSIFIIDENFFNITFNRWNQRDMLC